MIFSWAEFILNIYLIMCRVGLNSAHTPRRVRGGPKTRRVRRSVWLHVVSTITSVRSDTVDVALVVCDRSIKRTRDEATTSSYGLRVANDDEQTFTLLSEAVFHGSFTEEIRRRGRACKVWTAKKEKRKKKRSRAVNYPRKVLVRDKS